VTLQRLAFRRGVPRRSWFRVNSRFRRGQRSTCFVSNAAAIVHLGCRTGYPDELIAID